MTELNCLFKKSHSSRHYLLYFISEYHLCTWHEFSFVYNKLIVISKWFIYDMTVFLWKNLYLLTEEINQTKYQSFLPLICEKKTILWSLCPSQVRQPAKLDHLHRRCYTLIVKTKKMSRLKHFLYKIENQSDHICNARVLCLLDILKQVLSIVHETYNASRSLHMSWAGASRCVFKN
jgi:hypothetical protein